MASPVQIILTAIDRTKTAFASVKAGLASLADRARSLGGTLAALFAGVSVAVFIGKLKQTIDEMDRVGESAERIGTSAENFSALAYAAKMNASSTEELEAGLTKLSKSLADARANAGPAAAAFDALSIDAAQFTDPTDALLELADRFAALPDGVTKTALAMDIFGKSGARLIPMLNQGRAGLKGFMEEAADLGKVISDESARAAGEFNDNMDRLRAASEGLGVSLANEILPGLNQITEAMVIAAKEGGLLEALWTGLGGLGAAIFTDDLLSNAQALAKTQKQYNEALAGGFGREHEWVRELETKILVLKNAVAADEKAAAAERETAAARAKAQEDLAEQVEARRKATDEQVKDAERLKDALMQAFSASLSAEQDYLRQAKRLRAEANAVDVDQNDPEAQASAKLDALIALSKLQRLAASASLEDTQEQAAAVAELAAQLADAGDKTEILKAAKLAEAAALEKAAAEESDRARQQAEQIRAIETQAGSLGSTLAEIAKPATVEVTAGDGVQKTIEDLTKVKHLIEFIQNAGPVQVNAAAPAGTAGTAAALSTAAAQYGRRN